MRTASYNDADVHREPCELFDTSSSRRTGPAAASSHASMLFPVVRPYTVYCICWASGPSGLLYVCLWLSLVNDWDEEEEDQSRSLKTDARSCSLLWAPRLLQNDITPSFHFNNFFLEIAVPMVEPERRGI